MSTKLTLPNVKVKPEQVRAVAYRRVSSDEQIEGTSLDSQSERIASFCSAKGYSLIGDYVDPGFTGTTGDRPGLTALLADAKAGRFDVVVAFKIDRLGRKNALVLSLIETLKALDVGFASVTEPFETETAFGQAAPGMVSTFAQLERDLIVQRTSAGRDARRAQGGWVGGFVPFGYSYNSESRTTEVVEAEAAIVRRVFQLYTERLIGTKSLANLLNKEGIKPRSAKARGWHGAAVAELLRDASYKGQHRVGSIFPAIVAPSTWDAAQKRAKANKHIRPKEGQPWLLQGRLVCFEHGRTLRAAYSHGRRFYECPCRRESELVNESVCSLPRFNAGELERLVVATVQHVVSDPAAATVLADRRIAELEQRLGTLESTQRPLTERLAEAAESEERLAEAWVRGKLSEDKYAALAKEQEATRLALEMQLQAVGIDDVSELTYLRDALVVWKQRLGPVQNFGRGELKAAQDAYHAEHGFLCDGEATAEDAELDRKLDEGVQAYVGKGDMVAGVSPLLEGTLGLDGAVAQRLVDDVQLRVIAHSDHLVLTGLVPLGDIMFGAEAESPTFTSARCR